MSLIINSILIIIASIQLTLAGEEEATKDCVHTENDFKCVTYVGNYDADTITVNIPGIHPMLGRNGKIRVKGIDTPEIRTKNPCEKRAARTAKRLVAAELRNAKSIRLTNCIRGKYFRLVCNLKYDEKDLATILLENKMAYHYDGGRKPASIDWCRRVK